jgi:ATP-dependent DNA helicase RecG
MPLSIEAISPEQATKLVGISEGQFSDVKSIGIEPGKLTKHISAFANSDGGDLYVGIEEVGPLKLRKWSGFTDQEDANGHLQAMEGLFPLGTDFNYEFLKCDAHQGLVLHVQINKTQAIKTASNGLPYVRRGAQSLPVDTPEAVKRLEYAKGIVSFENELTNASKEIVTESEITASFIREIVPSAEPEPWLKKQSLLRDSRPTVAGVLLFADEPQAVLPKHCGIKVYWYKTIEQEGFRDALAFDPKTVEGCLYDQIKSAVQLTTEIVQGIPKMGDAALEAVRYPNETLHEIITNAALHRDYSIADDVHIRIFNNRIEVQSPGKLPGHVTVENILNERFARNGSVVRILNKFANAPNKDVGEGLNTAFEAMHQLGLKEPIIVEKDNSVLVIVKHEQLASAEEAIMDYLEKHGTIKNREARRITHVRADYQIKAVFGRMVKAGLIEQVPGTRTSNTAYRKKKQN